MKLSWNSWTGALICQEKDHRGPAGWEVWRETVERRQKKWEYPVSPEVQGSTQRTDWFSWALTCKWLSGLLRHHLSILGLEERGTSLGSPQSPTAPGRDNQLPKASKCRLQNSKDTESPPFPIPPGSQALCQSFCRRNCLKCTRSARHEMQSERKGQ